MKAEYVTYRILYRIIEIECFGSTTLQCIHKMNVVEMWILKTDIWSRPRKQVAHMENKLGELDPKFFLRESRPRWLAHVSRKPPKCTSQYIRQYGD